MLQRPLLEFELDSNLIAAFQIPATALNGNFLAVQLVEPGDYQARFEALAANEFQTTADDLYPIVGSRKYSFNFTMKDPRMTIYQCMRQLQRQAESTVQPGIPIQYITVRDYCLPEPEDFAIALSGGTRPFTTRQGFLYEVDLNITGGWYDESKGALQNTGSTVSWEFRDRLPR